MLTVDGVNKFLLIYYQLCFSRVAKKMHAWNCNLVGRLHKKVCLQTPQITSNSFTGAGSRTERANHSAPRLIKEGRKITFISIGKKYDNFFERRYLKFDASE